MIKTLSLLFVLLGIFSADALAQSGKITGTILDAETGEPLIGATVVLLH